MRPMKVGCSVQPGGFALTRRPEPEELASHPLHAAGFHPHPTPRKEGKIYSRRGARACCHGRRLWGLAGITAAQRPRAQMEQNPDPGPVDKSVLVEQEHHKSEAIFAGKACKPIRFIEHGTRLNQWEVRHEGMLTLLRRAGFYHLSFLKRVQLDHALLNALVERWRRETQTFHLRFGEMAVLLKDVAILTGLRVHGTPVTGATGCRWEQLCLELLGQEPPQIKGGSVNIAWLHDTFASLPDGAGKLQIEHATRAYIMYQFGCSLFPDPSGTRVHLRYLALLRDFDASGEMAWGAAALAHLYRELGKASMKGKANCCAFLTLLQLWAWEHIQIGCPERLENKDLTIDQPLGCRWDVPFKNRENVRSMDHEFYRHGLDTIADCQISWDPYKPSLIGGLPALCTLGSAVWRSKTPLICFQIVEMHVPDRVLLQFGMIQHIPDPVEAVERVTMQGKTDEDWSTYHEKYIKQWDNRLLSVADQKNNVNSDPTHARNCYLEWYWRITRRWISTPVECPVISDQLSGHSEKALVDLVSTVQVRIRTLLSGEMDGEKVKESLGDIDMYITAEMKKVMQIVLPTEIGNESLKSAMACSTSVDSIQANVGKVEQVTDGYMEGNTILQLEGMRGIQPEEGTLVRPPPRGNGTSNWNGDLHQQEDPIDVSMTEVNMQYIISTPVEDAMTGVISTSAENAMLEETSDAEMKNGESPLRTSSPLSEIEEMQEATELMYNNKIHNKVNNESQEFADAPVINNSTAEEATRVHLKDNYMEATHIYPNNISGQETASRPSDGPESYMILGVSSHNGQLQKNANVSGKGDKVEHILVMRTDCSIAEGAIGEALSATGPGETLSASVNKLSSTRGDSEPPSGSKQEEPPAAVPGSSELQDSVCKLPKDNAVQDRVHAVQNLMLQENVNDCIENGSLEPVVLQKLVVTPAHITIVGEKGIGPFSGEATDTLVEENSTGNGYPDQEEITKRRKVTVSSHENAEALPTTAVIKSEKQNGSGQFIAFTRRKRKKEVEQSSL
ncbi:uncharacterized protein [Lolium perenne]|uniref:uncharacterized protein isoform X2 n=1 Tax=Lolium perenne TaxID=4522 RepID=UPI0021F63417|nr:uncharacterized protein LOC127292708 isoform X2 [Lolium perenne]